MNKKQNLKTHDPSVADERRYKCQKPSSFIVKKKTCVRNNSAEIQTDNRVYQNKRQLGGRLDKKNTQRIFIKIHEEES